MEPIVRDLALGPTVFGALVFLAIGVVCLAKPYAVQFYALKLYRDPMAEKQGMLVPFMQSGSYILMLRVIGVTCAAIGLGLIAIVAGAFLVPGFAEFR